MSDIHPFDDPERLRLLLVDVHYGGDPYCFKVFYLKFPLNIF